MVNTEEERRMRGLFHHHLHLSKVAFLPYGRISSFKMLNADTLGIWKTIGFMAGGNILNFMVF